MYHDFLPDALALCHYFTYHKKRNEQSEVDVGGGFDSYGCRIYSLQPHSTCFLIYFSSEIKQMKKLQILQYGGLKKI